VGHYTTENKIKYYIHYKKRQKKNETTIVKFTDITTLLPTDVSIDKLYIYNIIGYSL